MRPVLAGKAGSFRAITQAEWDLLQACIRVREEIDKLEGGVIRSSEPDFPWKSGSFDRLHAHEAAAWERVKRERAQ